jgi:predicted O-methyltransferase YrrM
MQHSTLARKSPFAYLAVHGAFLSRQGVMTNRVLNLARQLSIVVRYRFFAARSDPRSMYEFVNVLTRFHYKRKRSALPESDVSELLPSASLASAMTLFSPPPEFFSIDIDELQVLCKFMQALAPQRVFEFGTFDGFTTLHLAAHAPTGCEVLTIDRLAGSYNFSPLRRFPHAINVGGRFHGHPLAGRIRQLTGDTRTFDFAPWAGTCDLVFLDADHGEEGTQIDTGNAMMLLKPGGVLLWHDCFAEGVAKFLAGFSATHPVVRIRSTTLAMHRKA